MKFNKLKKSDMVKIIAGKDVGKSGKIIEFDRDRGKVLVEGLNLVKKTIKKSQKNQNGGINDIEAFIDVSNVILICPKCKKETRVGFLIKPEDSKGNVKKVRVCKKCSGEIE